MWCIIAAILGLLHECTTSVLTAQVRMASGYIAGYLQDYARMHAAHAGLV